MRNKERFVPNSRACRRQLLLWTSGAVKTQPVTGKKGRRRRDMGRAPVGTIQSVRNMHTDQGVSRRGQPVCRLTQTNSVERWGARALDAWAEIIYLFENAHEYDRIVKAVRQLGDTVPRYRYGTPQRRPRDDDSPLRRRKTSRH